MGDKISVEKPTTRWTFQELREIWPDPTPEQRENRKSVATGLFMVISLWLWLVFSTEVSAVPYVALFIGGCMIGCATLLQLRRRLAIVLSPAAQSAVIYLPPVVICCAFGYFGHFENRESSEGRFVMEQRYRWNERAYFRKVNYRQGDGVWRTASGRLSRSEKPHGQWHVTSTDFNTPETDVWFWYGEVVSEGEFHRLNR